MFVDLLCWFGAFFCLHVPVVGSGPNSSWNNSWELIMNISFMYFVAPYVSSCLVDIAILVAFDADAVPCNIIALCQRSSDRKSYTRCVLPPCLGVVG
jgi:hypothetical protein